MDRTGDKSLSLSGGLTMRNNLELLLHLAFAVSGRTSAEAVAGGSWGVSAATSCGPNSISIRLK